MVMISPCRWSWGHSTGRGGCAGTPPGPPAAWSSRLVTSASTPSPRRRRRPDAVLRRRAAAPGHRRDRRLGPRPHRPRLAGRVDRADLAGAPAGARRLARVLAAGAGAAGGADLAGRRRPLRRRPLPG